MSLASYTFFLLPLFLFAAAAWIFLRLGRDYRSGTSSALENGFPVHHAVHFSQIRHALSQSDIACLRRRGHTLVAKKVSAERRTVVLAFVKVLRQDFQNLFRFGRVLAALSPEVAGRQEAQRLWLAARFELHYQAVRAGLFLGFSPLALLSGMTQQVSVLASRLDSAIARLDENVAMSLRVASGNAGARVDLL